MLQQSHDRSSSSKARKPVRLGRKTENRLLSYSAMAGAAGIAIAALSQPSAAEVVFTPANRVIGAGGSRLDLNLDGITDFFLTNFWFASHGSYNESVGSISIRGSAAGNHVITTSPTRFAFAQALDSGVEVSSRDTFGIIRGNKLFSCRTSFNGDSRSGPWINVKSKYLGLKFAINGETHFGWARLKVQQVTFCKSRVLLTGYAYETVPGMPIAAGQTSDTASRVVTKPTTKGASTDAKPTLGSLALGAQGLSAPR